MPSWLSRSTTGRDGEGTAPPTSDTVSGLGVSVDANDARVRVVLAGELDLTNADHFADRLNEAEGHNPEVIEIDLRGLTFMDSSGLAQIFAANRRARERNRRIVIVKDSGPIDRVLHLARVEDVIDVVEQPQD